LEVKTGSGSIDASAVRGAILASAGSGRIELEQAGEGDVSIHSGSGGVRVRGVRGGLDVSTSSGSIRAQGEMVRDWRLEASSGEVTVELPPEASFELDASTSSGSIDCERPLTVTGRISRKNLRGTVGSGGRRLAIETSSGSIEIR
jgi:lia operon protein LiaG